jgi:hypothetical protein
MNYRKVDAVLVLGMHRSGTSCASESLVNMGLNPGLLTELMGADEHNEHGYFEHSKIVECNEAILEGMVKRSPVGSIEGMQANLPGRGWLFGAWSGDVNETDYKKAALVVDSIAADLPSNSCMVLKDPRFSLTLSAWRNCLNIKAVILMVRSPAAVANSLLRRDGVTPIVAEELWELYNKSAVRQLEGLDTLVMDYEGLINNSRKEIRRVIDFLSKKGVPLSTFDENILVNSVDKKLNHVGEGDDSLVSQECDLIYQRLKIETLEQFRSNEITGRGGCFGGAMSAVWNIAANKELNILRKDSQDLSEELRICKSRFQRLNNHPVIGRLLNYIRFLKKDMAFGDYRGADTVLRREEK